MTAASASLPEATRLGRTALVVADRAAMTEFYRDVVGLAVQHRDQSTTTLGIDGTPLLVLQTTKTARPRDRDRTGLFHNAFRVPDRGALGAALARIRDRWQLEGASDHGISEALYLSDPEGNGVEIYCDKPRSEWPRTDDGTVRALSTPLALESLAADATGGPASTVPAGTTVGHVHLEVSSIDATRRFYVETLGFDETIEGWSSALFVAAGDYHHHVGANVWQDRSKPATEDQRGLAWFELVVPDDGAFDAVSDRLAASEVSTRRVEAPDGSGDDPLEVTDPDGIRIRIRTAA
ncbi:VOC family protein [Halopiger djelfimassiliensis]|uniref:VOC family protein n=1 Tax=Halopiger djelfimassiliensis TaxID=1293047 RepID=UPI0006780385|nr:VOC family protein [Halopiger djelfimassiliensis]